MKKPTYKILAKARGITHSAQLQQKKPNRLLMLYGIWKILEMYQANKPLEKEALEFIKRIKENKMKLTQKQLEEGIKMSVYITFGQNHIHKINNQMFDCNTVAEIKCEDYRDGKEKANKLFGDELSSVHTYDGLENILHFFDTVKIVQISI